LHKYCVRFDLTKARALCTILGMTNETHMRRIRSKLGWTQAEMAEYLGINRSNVSRIENGASASGPVRKLLADLDLKSREAAPEASPDAPAAVMVSSLAPAAGGTDSVVTEGAHADAAS
jgi:DNA-binding XRE family transcriptional regulator